jgi:hypothetical protein
LHRFDHLLGSNMHILKLVTLAALIPLAACQTVGSVFGSSDEPAPAPAEASASASATAPAAAPAPSAATIAAGPPCPYSAVLSEASTVTYVRGGGQTTADVIMTANISPPRLECEYDAASRTDDINFTFPLVLTKGPASTSDEGQITYFIALVNMAGDVIAKRVYQRRIVFGGKQSFIANERVDNLVLTLGPGTRPTDHRLLIGFQLTAEQLAYNRLRATQPLPPPTPVIAAPATPPPAVAPAPGTTPVPTPAPATTPAPAASATPAPAASTDATPAPAPTAAAPTAARPSTGTAPQPGATASATPAPAPAPTAASAPAPSRATLPADPDDVDDDDNAAAPATPPPAADTAPTTPPATTPADPSPSGTPAPVPTPQPTQ